MSELVSVHTNGADVWTRRWVISEAERGWFVADAEAPGTPITVEDCSFHTTDAEAIGAAEVLAEHEGGYTAAKVALHLADITERIGVFAERIKAEADSDIKAALSERHAKLETDAALWAAMEAAL